MITERRFADGFQSFWKSVMPMATDYIRRENLRLTRFLEPMAETSTANRGVTNELAFRLFAESRALSVPIDGLTSASIRKAITTAVDFIRRFREYSRGPLDAPSKQAVEEAIELAQRLEYFVVGRRPTTLTVQPTFPGCGWVDECSGDLLLDRTLCEVKASQDRFRSRDLRQVLIYAALNQLAGRYAVTDLCLVNPRLGVFLLEDLGDLCLEVAGAGPVDILNEIVAFISEPNPLGDTA